MTTLGADQRLMKRRRGAVAALLLGMMTAVCAAQAEFRGVWADAFHVGFKNAAQVDGLITRLEDGRYNAVLAEVLAFHDTGSSGHGAYWNSSIVPKASDISPSSFDPLAYLCQEAHARGIEVHAWLVPFRVSSSWPPAGNGTMATHPEWLSVPTSSMGSIAKVGSYYVLDPGSPEVQEYLISIVRELVTNYEIDGINYDYIRYTQTDAGYPSDTSYADSSLERFKRYTGYVGTPSYTYDPWEDYRRRTIDELIRRSRAEIPEIRTNPRQPLRLTADVFATGNAPAFFSSSDAYRLFQNWEHWMHQAWLDAAMPMNYKREHCSDQAQWYRNWIDATMTWKYNRHAYCGQGNYLNGMANSLTQMQYAYGQGAEGSMNYSYYATRSNNTLCDGSDSWSNDWTWYNYIATNLFTASVPTPTMPWRDPATATEGTIWGRVIDNTTGDPVEDASVTVSGRRDSTYTDANGFYVMTLVPSVEAGSTHTVTVTKTGFPSGSHPAVYLRAGDISRFDFALSGPAPTIEADPPLIAREAAGGETVPVDTFTVAAAAGDQTSISYAITDDASWLSVSPSGGTSNGEADEIVVIYDITGLPVGVHSAEITISDTEAANDPVTVAVELTVTTPLIPGDFDRDQDVDQEDMGRMQECLTGTAIPQDDPDCQDAKLDGDGDVDENDMVLFLGCMTDPNVPGDPTCANP